jgi:HEAT repeat protein
VDELVTQLAESDSSSVKAVYAWTLAYVGDVRAVEPLIALLGDPDVPDLTRGIAALGLGWTCEAVRLPWNTGLARDANLMRAPATFFNPNGGGGVLDIR